MVVRNSIVTSERLWTNFVPFYAKMPYIHSGYEQPQKINCKPRKRPKKTCEIELANFDWLLTLHFGNKKVQKTIMNEVWKSLSVVAFNQFLSKKVLKEICNDWYETRLYFSFLGGFYFRTTWEKKWHWFFSYLAFDLVDLFL